MFDTNGEMVKAPLSDRLISISGEQLRRVPEIVAVAGGRTKADAIRVVLRAGFVTTQITNASVAGDLLSGISPHVAESTQTLSEAGLEN